MTTRDEQSQGTKDVVEEYLAAWDAGDADRLKAVLHPDAEWIIPASAGIDPIRGRDAVIKALIGGASGLIDIATVRRHIEHVIADGVHAAVTMTLEATTMKGQPYANRYVWWLTTRDRQIVTVVEHTDTLAAARMFGWVSDATAG